jgi:hypothetical protein
MSKENFIGKDALSRIKEAGVTHRLAGLRVGGKRVDWYPADFYHVLNKDDGEIVGYVTSMWYSPAQESNIALAFLPVGLTEEGTELSVALPDVYATCPGVPELASVVPVPFKKVDSAENRLASLSVCDCICSSHVCDRLSIWSCCNVLSCIWPLCADCWRGECVEQDWHEGWAQTRRSASHFLCAGSKL